MAAALVAVVPMVALLAGCGADSEPNPADHLNAIDLGSRLADARAELATARRKLADARQQRVVVTGITKAAVQPDGPTRTVTALVDSASGPVAGVLVAFTVHGANAGASGTCVPVDCRSDSNGLVTFTYVVTHPGDDTVTIVCKPTIPEVTTVTRPPVQPPTTRPPRIFQVELRNCRNLHVGYDGFPAGVRVSWTVAQQGTVVAAGEFTATGGDDDGYHFLTQPLRVRLADVPDGAAHFTWVSGGVSSSYTAARAPGC